MPVLWVDDRGAEIIHLPEPVASKLGDSGQVIAVRVIGGDVVRIGLALTVKPTRSSD